MRPKTVIQVFPRFLFSSPYFYWHSVILRFCVSITEVWWWINGPSHKTKRKKKRNKMKPLFLSFCFCLQCLQIYLSVWQWGLHDHWFIHTYRLIIISSLQYIVCTAHPSTSAPSSHLILSYIQIPCSVWRCKT